MIRVGDCVLHQKTGHSGKVVGHSHQIADNVYLPTLLVRVHGVKEQDQKGFVEDLASLWMRLEG